MDRDDQAAPSVSAPSPVRPGAVLAVLSVAAFMASLDLFIVNVALPDIGRDLGTASLSDLSWTLNAYAIVYAALLVPFGRLADRYGRKGGFLLGVAVFTLASAGCAASGSLELLVAFRVLQAAGAALLTPTSLGLLLVATPAADRARAVRIWAATGALAAAAGPALGGVLVDASWRWVFLINLPIGLLAVVQGARLVPRSRDTRGTPLPDLVGAAVLALSIGALSLGLVKGPDWGWGSAAVLTSLGVAAAGTAVFWLRSLRHPSPVVDPALLRVRSFAFSNATAIVFSVAFAGNLLAVVLWMQDVWDYSALRTGLGVAVGPAMVPIFAAVGQRMSRRIGAGWIAATGCLLFAVGVALVAFRLTLEPSYAGVVLPSLLVGGAGVGLALPTILSTGTADLPADRSATGSAVVNMSRQIGAVLGIAVFVAVLGTPVTPGDVLDSFTTAWLVLAGVGVLAAVVALGMTPRADVAPLPVDVAGAVSDGAGVRRATP
jgi:EmrB/QacA subfamily drug resistance transporter